MVGVAGSGFDTVSTGGALDWDVADCGSGCEPLGSPLAKEPLISQCARLWQLRRQQATHYSQTGRMAKCL